MASISLFGLTIDKDGAVRAIREVTESGVKMAQDGAKNAQLYADAYREKLNRVAREYIPETMRAIDALAERNRVLTASRPAGTGLPGILTAEEVARSGAAYDAMIAKTKGIEEASGAAFAGFGRVRQGLTSLAAQMTGTIPVLDRIGSQFFAMAAGGPVALAVVAGITAIAMAWHYATAEARELAKETDKAVKSLLEWEKAQQQGVGGKLGEEITLAEARLTQMRQRMAALALTASGNAPGQLGEAGLASRGPAQAALERTKKEYDALAKAVEDGERHIADLKRKAGDAAAAQNVRDLAALITAGEATAAQRRNAELMITGLNQTIAALKGNGSRMGEATDAIALRDQLQGALHPEDHDAERAAAKAARDAARDAARMEKEKAADDAMMQGMQDEYVASLRLVGAMQQGTDALKAMDREEEVRQALAATGLSQDDARYAQAEFYIRNTLASRDAVKAFTEAEKERAAEVKKAGAEFIAEQKRQAEEVDRLFKSSFSSLFVGIVEHGKDAFQSLWDAIKQGFIKLLADMLAAKASARLAGLFAGMMLVPGTSYGMTGAGGNGGVADANDPTGTGGSNTRSAAFGGAAGLGVGYGVGRSLYSDSHSGAQNYLSGAYGGAAAGGLSAFAATGSPIAAVAGAIGGLVGGILGVGSASREAERHMRELQATLSDNLKLLTAQIHGDTLGAALIQSGQQFEALRRQADEAYSGRSKEGDRARAYAQINALEDERVRQLKEEAALVKQRFAEDLQVRLLAAQGHTKEAESLRLQLAQQREYQQAIKDGADPATLALLQQVQAQEKLAAATNQANSAALNMVEGYKIQAAIFGASSGRAPGAGSSSYGAPSSASRTSGASGDLTVNVVMPDGSVLGKAVLKDFKGRAARQYGDATRWSDVQ